MGSGDLEPQTGCTRMVVIGAIGAMIIAQLSHPVATEAGLFSGALFFDADVYMWFTRVEALAEGQGWFDQHEPRVFPPEGHVQHWTRPVDALLLAGGAVLGQVFGFRDGLALWGNLISPLLLVAAGGVTYRLARLLMARLESAIAAGVFVLYPAILGMFAWGRADHHSLLGLGQVAFYFGLLSFFLNENHRSRWAFATGLIGAVAIWVNVEALAYVLIGLVVLGLWWLVGRRDLVRANVAMSGGLLAGTILAVGIERGPRFFETFPIDTIGFPYVVLFGLTWLFWIGLWAWTRYGRESAGIAGRAAVATVLAAGVLGGVAVAEPSFFAGPFAHVDELYREVRLEYLSEQLPLIMPSIHGPLAMVGRALSFFAVPLIGLWAVIRYTDAETSSRVRWAWGLLAGSGLIFAVLSQDAVRWTVYIPAGAAPCFALAAGRLLRWIERRRTAEDAGFVQTNLVRPLAVVAVLVGIPAAGAGLQFGSEHIQDRRATPEHQPATGVAGDAADRRPDCDLRPAAAAVRQVDDLEARPLVAINPDHSGEWLYRTDHAVTAIANHRPQPGFSVYVEAMAATDLEAAHRQLTESGVELVMVCEPTIWPVLRDEGASTIERLADGERTGPFERIVAPEEGGGWSIYRVGGD